MKIDARRVVVEINAVVGAEVVREGVHTIEETKIGKTKELTSMCQKLKNLQFQTDKVTDVNKELGAGIEYPTQIVNSLIIFLEKTLFRIQEWLKMNS